MTTATQKVLLITYSPDDDPDQWTRAQGINTYIIDATREDIQHLQSMDQHRICDWFSETEDVLKRHSSYYISHRMGWFFDSIEDFDRDVKNDAFSAEELALLKREDFEKWIDTRQAGINNCEGVDLYFSVDMSDE